MSAATRCGFAAIAGAPNAGKSTLVNRLVGSKVAIVSRKVQTTRSRLRGVMVHEQSQVILVDTPGIFRPKRTLDKMMVEAAWAGVEEADLVCHLVDAPDVIHAPEGYAARDTATIRSGLSGLKSKRVLVLNKIDAIARDRLLPLIEKMSADGLYEKVFLISAEKGHGTQDLRVYLAASMPEGPWAYPDDQAADISSRALAAEITRERIYDRLHEELPYATTVVTDRWVQNSDGSARIDQTIVVERDTQRAIVLGNRGDMIKLLGSSARLEMEKLFGHRVHLFLHVKVRDGWSDDAGFLRELGLDHTQS